MSEYKIKSQLIAWNQYLKRVRSYFDQNGFLEVNTPTLVKSPGSEPFLDFFETQEIWGQQSQKKYLPASPEISLKKLLGYNLGNIYEIRTCFRNQECSPIHRTEFFLLEWYSPELDLFQLIQQSFDFIKYVATGSLELPEKPKCLRIQDLFQMLCQFDLTPSTSSKDLFLLAKKQGLSVEESWGFDDLFHLLMIEKVEPYLKSQNLVFVTHYPPSQAALSKLDEMGWAERFEIYINGIELANAYRELIDPVEQVNRYKKDNRQRVLLGRPEVPLDFEFILALQKGLPDPVSGIAFGLERFFMILNQEESIHFWSPLWKFKNTNLDLV
jgi:lysyl-tRNA synthetase class 2